MTTDSVPMQDPQDNLTPVEAQADAAVKPKRTRRPKAADVVAEAAAPVETEVPAAVAAKRAPLAPRG